MFVTFNMIVIRWMLPLFKFFGSPPPIFSLEMFTTKDIYYIYRLKMHYRVTQKINIEPNLVGKISAIKIVD